MRRFDWEKTAFILLAVLTVTGYFYSAATAWTAGRPKIAVWLGDNKKYIDEIDETGRVFKALSVDVVTIGTGCCGDKRSKELKNFDNTVKQLASSGALVNIVPAHLEMDAAIDSYPPVDELGRTMKKGCRGCSIPFDVFNPEMRKAYLQVTENVAVRYGENKDVFGFTLFGPGIYIEWEYYFSNWRDPNFPAYSEAAQTSFRNHLKAKYADINSLNAAWGTTLKSWNDAKPPKPWKYLTDGSIDKRPDWVDFQEWYQNELELFLDQTLQTIRKHTNKPIVVLFASAYGVHQGSAGVSWGRSVKTLSRYKPIYIKSNGTERMIASYARTITSFYGVGLWFESTVIRTTKILDAIATNSVAFGADYMHLNSVASIDDLFSGDFKEARKRLDAVSATPVKPNSTAFFHNATAGTLRVESFAGIKDYQNTDLIACYSSGPLWKNDINFGDYYGDPPVVDETLILDGALKSYSRLVIPNQYPFVIPADVAERLAAWVGNGGTFAYVRQGYVLDPQRRALIDFDEFMKRKQLGNKGFIKVERVEDLKRLP